MNKPTLRDSQLAMARYLRNPAVAPAPQGVEQRRLDIYRRLVFKNIEGFISSGFPVLRSLYDDDDWHALVQAFIDGHRCQTPYFLEISQEFIQFLLHEYSRRDIDPPFMAELAHYEWVELALGVAEEHPPASFLAEDILGLVLQLSPLAWLLSYHYPVHRIGPAFRPTVAGEPCYLVVYRDRQERVHFMELNAATARLVELTRDNSTLTATELLAIVAAETGMNVADLLGFGAELLADLAERSVLGLAGQSEPRHTEVAPPVPQA